MDHGLWDAPGSGEGRQRVVAGRVLGEGVLLQLSLLAKEPHSAPILGLGHFFEFPLGFQVMYHPLHKKGYTCFSFL